MLNWGQYIVLQQRTRNIYVRQVGPILCFRNKAEKFIQDVHDVIKKTERCNQDKLNVKERLEYVSKDECNVAEKLEDVTNIHNVTEIGRCYQDYHNVTEKMEDVTKINII